MKADEIPTVAIVILVEFLFGIGYNALVAWAHKNKLVHVSVSVAVGVFGTLLIPAVTWLDSEMQFWQAGILLILCFTASGAPMIVGSMRRTVDEEKDNKRRRPWPNEARRVRDDVVMELASMAHEIAGKSKHKRLAVNDLPDYVNRLHSVIGRLKSV